MTRAVLSEDDVLRAVAGERAAVERFTRAFLPRVYGLCLRLSRRRELAEEACQETFVRALAALPKLRDPARLDAWILRIAANTTRRLLAKAGREGPLDWEPAAIEPSADDEALARRKAVDLAVAELATPERELFLLHTVEGVRLRELARRRGTTPAALKARMHRIRSKVRVRALRHLERAGVRP